MRITVDRKILGGVVFCSVILFSIAFISFYNSEKFRETNQWVTHTHEVLYEFQQILIHCVDAETGERGFIITGNEKYLEPYSNASTQINEHLANVKELTKDNPRQQKNVQDIHQLITRLTERLSANIAIRKTAGFEKALLAEATDSSKNILDNIRKEIRDARVIEEGLLFKRKQDSETDARNFNNISIILVITIAIVLLSVYLIIISNFKALRQAQTEAINKNTILEGTSGLAKEIQGNIQVSHLAQKVINYLAVYTNASVGALYIAGEDTLKMISAYAAAKSPEGWPLIRFGEGLAGQAAAEKSTIHVSSIPPGNFDIKTSFGNVTPKSVIAFPVIYENSVTCVIELGTLTEFTPIHLQFLSIVGDSIAVAFTSSQAREQTKELLEETQRQSEELVAQQEELRQTNDELHTKTEQLERSEMELKAQQEELQQTNESLEEKATLLETQKNNLKAAKLEVEAKAQELQQSGKYKSEFLANMSHELRTPLNSILILSQLLAENKQKVLGEKEQKHAQSIYSSGKELLSLINEVLDLSKVEAGKIELDITEVRISDIVNNMHSMFNEMAKNKYVEFSINDRTGLENLILLTDEQRVEQILRNLLSNAFKFTSQSGKVQLEIGIKTYKQHQRISFTVTDTGIGIAKNKQALVFEAFQQADGSTKRKYGGTGLGLSISKKLAQALGGEIYLQSEEGKGSTFTLDLPLKFDESDSTLPNDKIEIKKPETGEIKRSVTEGIIDIPANVTDDRYTITAHDRVILIIEDDEDFAQILLNFVKKKNYKGIITQQGNAGLSFARHYKPDSIILDMNLPEMDGSEVIKKLKADPELRHIPIQIFSGHDRKKETMELGVFDFIRKPVTQTDIETALDRMKEFTLKKLKKLLIIEDNKEQSQTIKELIGNGDIKLFSAYSGAEAYEKMRIEKFDCIIIDLGLPDMSGIDLMEKIKSDTELAKIPIIVYTGKDLSKVEIARLNQLADTVVLKTANSIERLLDETVLFLHYAESKLPKEKQQMIRKVHRSDEVLKKRKVLLVDDDMRNIYSLTNALEEEELVCLNAGNGIEALQKLEENTDIDIVLMDLMMPDMDGFETMQQIRKIDKYAKLPVIALTAKAMKGDREKCLEAGFSDYISKPVNLTQLISLMRVWLYR
ncbi:response regulator [Niastella sp. OAS944]|uniref:response regulator n=1 Tax=Niastella sp. OAS944 TaxID=2664089 RepID=UPI003480290F|nr:CheY-like chemotaxis protein/CHASE3 domain sensor protein [Chitinophagaceae bacterium OAS944]